MVGWDAQLRYLADEVSKATPLDRRRPKASSIVAVDRQTATRHSLCLGAAAWLKGLPATFLMAAPLSPQAFGVQASDDI